MPITVKDVSWTEDEGHVSVEVFLKNACKSTLHTTISDVYIKLSSPPYIWEEFLAHEITPDDCKATVFEKNKVHLRLKKKEDIIWNKFNLDDLTAERKMCIRNEAVERGISNNKEEHEKKKQQTKNGQSFCVQQQIKMEQETRNEMKRLQELDKQRFFESCAKVEVEEDNGDKQPTWLQKVEAKDSKAIPSIRKQSQIVACFTQRGLPTAARESQIIFE